MKPVERHNRAGGRTGGQEDGETDGQIGGQISGYTLIEMLIAVVVLSILSSMALPTYQHVVRRTHRGEAMSLLQELQLRQEKWRADNSAYTGTPDQLGVPTAGPVVAHYALSIPLATAASYTLRATARSTSMQSADTQNGSSCSQLEIDQSGLRTPDACWR